MDTKKSTKPSSHTERSEAQEVKWLSLQRLEKGTNDSFPNFFSLAPSSSAGFLHLFRWSNLIRNSEAEGLGVKLRMVPKALIRKEDKGKVVIVHVTS